MHYLIVNPVAGRGRALALLGQAERFFADRALPLTVLRTAYPRHATELVRALPLDARVLSLGGDGTLHEVAAACVRTQRHLGVLPAGSGDDLAFALGLPRRDLAVALHGVLAGRLRQLDVGEVNGEVFVNAFGVGFDADVAYGVAHAPKPLKERSAYLYTIVDTLRRLRTIEVGVRADGAEVFQGPSLLVAVQNGPRTGGSFLFAPGARPDDGLLDLVVAGDFSRRGTLAILPRVMRGRHLGHPKIHLFRAKRVQLRWAQARPAHMEGELMAASSAFDISVLKGVLQVYAP